MAVDPRRFYAYPRNNVMGHARMAAVAEGVQFTDGTVVVRWTANWPTSVILPLRGLDALEQGAGFGGPLDVEFID